MQSAKLPNLFIMPAGPKPPYPAELLGSNRMKALIKSWRPSYDHIIFDTPPMLSVTDPVLLSVDVDSVVLVVRFAQTTKQALKQVREILDQVNARVCGVILNSVETSIHLIENFPYLFQRLLSVCAKRTTRTTESTSTDSNTGSVTDTPAAYRK